MPALENLQDIKAFKEVSHNINVLIVGEGKTIPIYKQSKFLNKLYTTVENKDASHLPYTTFRELANKCKNLNIDIVFIEDENIMQQGICDVLRFNFVNCIGAEGKWVDYCTQPLKLKKLMQEYLIKTPQIYKFPHTFPLRIRSLNLSEIARNMDELFKIKKEFDAISDVYKENTFLEEIIDGENINITFIYDGKNLEMVSKTDLWEEQQEKLNEFINLFKYLLYKEKAQFITFIEFNLIWYKNHFYLNNFSFNFKNELKYDVIFIIMLAIYQKLNYINLKES